MTDLVSHLDAAYNLARWLTRNEQDAEDIVHEAYLRAFRFSAGFRGSEVRPWLLAIVRNSCYDFLRQRHAHGRVRAFDEEIHSADPKTPNQEASLLQHERAGLVRDAVAELPVRFREVLVLRELEDLSYREIASITGVPLGTVMSRLNRGRQQIQRKVLLHSKREKM